MRTHHILPQVLPFNSDCSSLLKTKQEQKARVLKDHIEEASTASVRQSLGQVLACHILSATVLQTGVSDEPQGERSHSTQQQLD